MHEHIELLAGERGRASMLPAHKTLRACQILCWSSSPHLRAAHSSAPCKQLAESLQCWDHSSLSKILIAMFLAPDALTLKWCKTRCSSLEIFLPWGSLFTLSQKFGEPDRVNIWQNKMQTPAKPTTPNLCQALQPSLNHLWCYLEKPEGYMRKGEDK